MQTDNVNDEDEFDDVGRGSMLMDVDLGRHSENYDYA